MIVKIFFEDDEHNVFSVNNMYSKIPTEKECIEYFDKYYSSCWKYLKSQYFDYRNDTWIDLI